MDRRVEAADGRALLVSDLGESSGPAVLSFHGSGMGRVVYQPYLDDAVRRGVRVLSYDRPGLGGSTRRPGYCVVDCAEDVRAIAEALDLERIGVWGISGGGPFALACAARLPDLVWAAASVEGRAPSSGTGPEWEDLEAARAGFAARAAADFETAASVDAVIADYSSGPLCAADVSALRRSVGAWFAADARDALAVGGDGWFDEAFASARDWGFDLSEISVPVLVMHGRLDTWVDPSNATRLANDIPKSELQLMDEDGHLSLADRLPDVTDWLLSHSA